jgi:hypothetical protein
MGSEGRSLFACLVLPPGGRSGEGIVGGLQGRPAHALFHFGLCGCVGLGQPGKTYAKGVD